MSSFGEEKTKEFLSMIRQVLVNKPNVTNIQVQKALEDNGVRLNHQYIGKLVRKIRQERYTRFDNQTVKKVLAEFEDFIEDTSQKLLKVYSTSKLDMAKIIALDTRVKHYNILLDKLFDAGVFERKLGTIEGKYTNVAQVLKILKDERDQQRKLKSSGHRLGDVARLPAEQTDTGTDGTTRRGESA
jgi:arginine repressor